MPLIDYSIISAAIEHYQKHGYKYVTVPWFVLPEVNNVTKPVGVHGFHVRSDVFDGELVGSGEQGFIELMEIGLLPLGKYVTCTPCFRSEPYGYDELHQPYFMKVELINTWDTSDEQLDLMIAHSLDFFHKYVKTDVATIDDNNYDIYASKTKEKIELGSYGRRKWKDYKWLYGTGVALPRLSQAIELEANDG